MTFISFGPKFTGQALCQIFGSKIESDSAVWGVCTTPAAKFWVFGHLLTNKKTIRGQGKNKKSLQCMAMRRPFGMHGGTVREGGGEGARVTSEVGGLGN